MTVVTDGDGKACFGGFYGDYEAEIDGKNDDGLAEKKQATEILRS